MKKVLVVICAIFFMACNANKNSTKKVEKEYFKKNIIGVWQMMAIRFHDGRVMLGEYMGNPYYQFSEAGKRTKILRTVPAPPPEVIAYEIKKGSIFYPNTKFPSMKLKMIAKDTLVFSNAQLSWHLVRSTK